MKWEIQSYVCGQVISVCNSKRVIKIGQYLRKLCSNEKGPSFLWLTVYKSVEMQFNTSIPVFHHHHGQLFQQLLCQPRYCVMWMVCWHCILLETKSFEIRWMFHSNPSSKMLSQYCTTDRMFISVPYCMKTETSYQVLTQQAAGREASSPLLSQLHTCAPRGVNWTNKLASQQSGQLHSKTCIIKRSGKRAPGNAFPRQDERDRSQH